MKKFLLIFLLALASLSGCSRNNDDAATNTSAASHNEAPQSSVPSVEQDPEVPLLWRATSPVGQTMYLFGSIHAADASIYPLPNFIMDAFHRSDYLAVEVNTYAFEQDLAAQMEFAFRMLYLDGRTIVDDIGEDLHARATAVLVEQGFSPGFYDGFKPYAWWSLLLLLAVQEAGMDAEYGLDLYFIRAAVERGMEILEVESMDLQMDVLLGFSPELSAFMLEESLDIEAAAEGLLIMYDAWKRGDEQLLIDLFEYEYSGMPTHLWEEYNNALLIQRDIDMTEIARQFMAEGRKVFYVVGLAHLIGQDSVIYLLMQEGYAIERIWP